MNDRAQPSDNLALLLVVGVPAVLGAVYMLSIATSFDLFSPGGGGGQAAALASLVREGFDAFWGLSVLSREVLGFEGRWWILFFGATLFLLLLLFIRRRRMHDFDDTPAASDAFGAFFAAFGLIVIGVFHEWLWARRVYIGLLAALVYLAWVVFTFLQHNRERARPESAIRRTQSDISESLEESVQVIVGGLLVSVSVVLGALNGAFGSIGTLDQFLTPMMNEAAYTLLALIGYGQLGGTFPGSSLIPHLHPMQWLGLAGVIAAIALIFREN